jgi:hypothetical protein
LENRTAPEFRRGLRLVKPLAKPIVAPTHGKTPASLDIGQQFFSVPSPMTSDRAHWASSPWDQIGILLSAVCLIHCLITPILLLVLSLMKINHQLPEIDGLHEVLAWVLPVIALISFIPGYRLHRDSRVFVYGAIGISLIILGAQFHHAEGFIVSALNRLQAQSPLVHVAGIQLQAVMISETLITVLGSALLVRAHLLNRVQCRGCRRHKPAV